jgi:hypothetical protein
MPMTMRCLEKYMRKSVTSRRLTLTCLFGLHFACEAENSLPILSAVNKTAGQYFRFRPPVDKEHP